MESLTEARQFLKENWENGCECPVCKQFVKKYHRPITSAMAYVLILIYQYFKEHNKEECLHIEEFLKKKQNVSPAVRGDFPKLRFWNLIEGRKERRKDGSNRNGYWSITSQGIDFVENRTKVFRSISLYNNHFFGFNGDKISIQEALKDRFNYKELMKTYSYDLSDNYNISDTDQQLELF